MAKICNRTDAELDEVHWEGGYNLEWFWVRSVPDCIDFVVSVSFVDRKAVWRQFM